MKRVRGACPPHPPPHPPPTLPLSHPHSPLQQQQQQQQQQATRANLDCNLLTSWLILPGSAHCLRHDPLWYAGYDVGPGVVDFGLDLTASGGVVGGPLSLSLSPSTPAAAAPGIAARLLGDLVAYRAMPDFGGHVLMVPFPPGEENGEGREARDREGKGDQPPLSSIPSPSPCLSFLSRLHPGHRPGLQPVRLAHGGPVPDVPVRDGVRPGGDGLRRIQGAAGE